MVKRPSGEGSHRVYMAPPAGPHGEGLMDSARHVKGCHLAQETRVHSVLDDEGLAGFSPRHTVPFNS